MARVWLRHPPRTVRRPLTCPSGRPRYATEWLAGGTAALEVTPCGLIAAVCGDCGGGWHLYRPGEAHVVARPGDRSGPQTRI